MVNAIAVTFNETLSKNFKHLEVSMIIDNLEKLNIL